MENRTRCKDQMQGLKLMYRMTCMSYSAWQVHDDARLL